jgi:hypothetical protein
MKRFLNRFLTYFATCVSYECKMFMKWTPGRCLPLFCIRIEGGERAVKNMRQTFTAGGSSKKAKKVKKL